MTTILSWVEPCERSILTAHTWSMRAGVQTMSSPPLPFSEVKRKTVSSHSAKVGLLRWAVAQARTTATTLPAQIRNEGRGRVPDKRPGGTSHVRSLLPEKAHELYGGKYLRTGRPEIVNVPRADDISSVFGGRLPNDAILDVVVSPDRSNCSGV